MVTNFDYLKNESRFSDFAEVAISAEKIILIDPQASIINCRRAMEFAVKWMYSVDEELEMPYQDNLQSLMNNEDFRDIVGPDIWKRMDYIRRCGNNAAHSNKKLGKDIAMLCLENLFIYLDFVACCYSGNYEERTFDRSVLTERIEKAKESKKLADATKEQLVREQERTAQQELDLKKLQERPGIICYVVQPEDTLWDIAKKYYTTSEHIRNMNHLTEEIRAGQKLLIVKSAVLHTAS